MQALDFELPPKKLKGFAVKVKTRNGDRFTYGAIAERSVDVIQDALTRYGNDVALSVKPVDVRRVESQA